MSSSIPPLTSFSQSSLLEYGPCETLVLEKIVKWNRDRLLETSLLLDRNEICLLFFK